MIFILGWLFLITGFSQVKGNACKGFFRWEVKTLTDSGGIDLLSARISDSRLTDLVAVHPPKHFFILSTNDGRLPRYDDEKQQVKVVAMIVSVKTEHDRDLHIVLKAPGADVSMIGEIPDPDCRIFDSLPALRHAYEKARREMQVAAGQLRATGEPVMVEITGVPFWDARHWWLRGCAKNGREIHPILSVKTLP
ncbi:MAG: hypothetical protein NT040_12565 [Bacteroidetes bacterium]|nr:hypothetical protein [Bacteroidota bacterium]